MTVKMPKRGWVFWPVGTGDSTTVAVDDDTFFQVDVHHLAKADDSEEPHMPVVDELVAVLPQKSGRPYLAAFALTHPDEDHCSGFADLLKRVTIGELWFTPRIFLEHKDDLCDDAAAFKKEAMRRVKATIKAGGAPPSGDRVRVVGWDDVLKEEDFKGFPNAALSVPGTTVTSIDGQDLKDVFCAFVHAPFRDDVDAERNDSSLGLQIRLIDGAGVGRVLLLGDLCYPSVSRIFESSKEDDVAWDVFLAPHHCSKSVMYWQDEGEDDETLKQELLDKMEAAAGSPGVVVASSAPVPTRNASGDNPPHAKAKDRYEEIAPGGFFCTMEHPNETHPEPVIFEVSTTGVAKRSGEKSADKRMAPTVSAAVTAARGTSTPPKDRVGFGIR